MTSRLQSSSHSCLAIVTPGLTTLIMSPDARLSFSEAGGIEYISRHLRSEGVYTHPRHVASTPDHLNSLDNNNAFASERISMTKSFSNPDIREKQGATVQQRYELTYCLWVMSFECEFKERIRHNFHRDGAVTALVEVVGEAPREKVVRLALSTLKNLAICTDKQLATSNDLNLSISSNGRKTVFGSRFLNEMIGCGLMKTVLLMKDRHWNDPEMLEGMDLWR